VKREVHRSGYLAAGTAIVLGGLGSGPAIAAVDPAIRPYSAVYQIEYKGRIVGRSEFSVRYDKQDERYRFSSSSSFRGILRFLSPNPVVERSDFVSEAGRITSLEFWLEDGSRKGDENINIKFDWSSGIATATTENQQNEYPIERGTLDRGTMQVQLMIDMARAGPQGGYTLADGDGLRTYAYRAEPGMVLETPLGQFETEAFIQERSGSSRQTFIWAAPDLHHLPVRIEQKRAGQTRTVLLLESVDWLDAATN
jgi:hypothetical protein